MPYSAGRLRNGPEINHPRPGRPWGRPVQEHQSMAHPKRMLEQPSPRPKRTSQTSQLAKEEPKTNAERAQVVYAAQRQNSPYRRRVMSQKVGRRPKQPIAKITPWMEEAKPDEIAVRLATERLADRFCYDTSHARSHVPASCYNPRPPVKGFVQRRSPRKKLFFAEGLTPILSK